MQKTSHCLSNTGGDDLNGMQQICCHLGRRVNCWRVTVFRCHWWFNGIISWILARYLVKTKEWKNGPKHKCPLGKKKWFKLLCSLVSYMFHNMLSIWSLTNSLMLKSYNKFIWHVPFMHHLAILVSTILFSNCYLLRSTCPAKYIKKWYWKAKLGSKN
jgi:hypothetical protein